MLLMVLADISSSPWELRTEQKLQTEGKSMYKHHILACSPDWSMWHTQDVRSHIPGPLAYEYCHTHNHQHYLSQT